MVNVAQLVRALDCGSRGRGFESHLSPRHLKLAHSVCQFFCSYRALKACFHKSCRRKKMVCCRQPALNVWQYPPKGIMTPSIARRNNPFHCGLNCESTPSGTKGIMTPSIARRNNPFYCGLNRESTPSKTKGIMTPSIARKNNPYSSNRLLTPLKVISTRFTSPSLLKLNLSIHISL